MILSDQNLVFICFAGFCRLEYTCRETFPDLDGNTTFESYLISHYPPLNESMQTFRRLKIRAEIDLVVRHSPLLLLRISIEDLFLLLAFHIDRNGIGRENV